MSVSITGLTFTAVNQGTTPNSGYVCFIGSGTYTLVDFSITPEDGLGFRPSKVRVCDLTNRNETMGFFGTGVTALNTTGLKTVAAGTRTYAARGITVETDEIKVTIDESVAGPIADNSVFVIECWA